MNYAGHEKLRAEVAEVANAMCDLRTTMNEMERRYSFNADTLPERLVRQTLFRANRLLMEAIPKFWNWIPASKIEGREYVRNMRNTLPGAGSKVSGRHATDAGCLVP